MTPNLRRWTRSLYALAALLMISAAHCGQAEVLPAVVHWSQRVEMAFPQEGVVQDVFVEAGQHVRAGQGLAALDQTIYRARVAEHSAAAVRIKEEAAEAARDLARVQELYNRTVISTSELDQAKVRDIKAQSLVREAEARLVRARKSLQDATLRAPFNGVVISRSAEKGMVVYVGLKPQTMLVLARDGERVARAQLAPAQASRLRIGQAATVKLAEQSYRAAIRSIAEDAAAGPGKDAWLVDVLFRGAALPAVGSAAEIQFDSGTNPR